MEASKRHLPEEAAGDHAVVVKRQRTDGGLLVTSQQPTAAKEALKRTSPLQAPIMQLTGHAGQIFTVRFNLDGDVIASGSHDKHIFLWRTYGDCDNFMMIKGHKNAVMELHWTADGERLLSCSPDKSVRVWSAATGEQVKKMAEHDSCVNSCAPLRRGAPLLVSGSDDGTAKVWDLRVKRSIQTLPETYQILAVAFSDAGDQVYTGGIENVVNVWDLRKAKVAFTLNGHSDSITGMQVSPDGTHLLTNAMDNTLRVWDLRPFAPANRCTKVFTGHQHSFEKNLLRCDWSPDGSQVTAGSADRCHYIWDTTTRRLLYSLPGHTGSVNEAVFHPTQPIVASGSSDKTIFLGELSQ